MNTERKTLKLQINRACFKSILSGEQKIEHRFVYKINKDRYVTEEESVGNNEDEFELKVTPIHYDSLTLINGRRPDAPRLEVEIVKSEFVVLTDEDGNDLIDEDGCYICQVWYYLGDVLWSKNIPENF